MQLITLELQLETIMRLDDLKEILLNGFKVHRNDQSNYHHELDQTSHFTIVSCQGHKYIMCLSKVDDNYMAFDLTRSHDKAGMIPVYDRLIDRL